jgi:H+/Cl- antiporter ClcA
LGDSIVHWLGLPHTSYAIRSFPEIDFLFLAKAAVAAVTFGLAGRLFIGAGHLFGAAMGRFRPLSRPVVGAALVLGISALLGTTDYLGLGVHGQTPESTSIVAAFSPGGVDPFSWFWKLLLTTLTLASGFKGGEVTPLFFVGSTLGNALAEPLGLPVDLLAALGFIALFAAASGTPLASTLMAGEIFGFQWAPLFLAVNLLARVATGPRTIYDEA